MHRLHWCPRYCYLPGRILRLDCVFDGRITFIVVVRYFLSLIKPANIIAVYITIDGNTAVVRGLYVFTDYSIFYTSVIVDEN